MYSNRGVYHPEPPITKISELKQTYLEKQLQIESLEREREATLRLLNEAQKQTFQPVPMNEKSMLLEEARRRQKERALLSDIGRPERRFWDANEEKQAKFDIKVINEEKQIGEDRRSGELKNSDEDSVEFKHFIDKEYLQLNQELENLRKGTRASGGVGKMEGKTSNFFEKGQQSEAKYKERPTRDSERSDFIKEIKQKKLERNDIYSEISKRKFEKREEIPEPISEYDDTDEYIKEYDVNSESIEKFDEKYEEVPESTDNFYRGNKDFEKYEDICEKKPRAYEISNYNNEYESTETYDANPKPYEKYGLKQDIQKFSESSNTQPKNIPKHEGFSKKNPVIYSKLQKSEPEKTDPNPSFKLRFPEKPENPTTFAKKDPENYVVHSKKDHEKSTILSEPRWKTSDKLENFVIQARTEPEKKVFNVESSSIDVIPEARKSPIPQTRRPNEVEDARKSQMAESVLSTVSESLTISQAEYGNAPKKFVETPEVASNKPVTKRAAWNTENSYGPPPVFFNQNFPGYAPYPYPYCQYPAYPYNFPYGYANNFPQVAPPPQHMYYNYPEPVNPEGKKTSPASPASELTIEKNEKSASSTPRQQVEANLLPNFNQNNQEVLEFSEPINAPPMIHPAKNPEINFPKELPQTEPYQDSTSKALLHKTKILEEVSGIPDQSNLIEDKEIQKQKAVLLEFGTKKNKTLAEMFKEKNRKVIAHMHSREDNITKQDHRDKTKEELVEIRKNMVKGSKIDQKNSEIIEFQLDEKKNSKEPSSDLMKRLATGQRAKVSKEEMLKLNKKNYKLLPEVKKRQEDEKKRKEKEDRIKKARDYEKIRQDKQKFKYVIE